MKEKYVKWQLPILGFETEMLVFGKRGSPIIIFPSSIGRYNQNNNLKLIDSVKWFFEICLASKLILAELLNKKNINNLPDISNGVSDW